MPDAAAPAQVGGAGEPAAVRLRLDDPRWRDFVSARPEATPFHEPAWAAFLAEVYSFDAFVLATEADGVLTAGIPVLKVRRPFGGRRWVSLPFTDECVPLGTDMPRLARAVDSGRRDHDVSFYEIRAPLPVGTTRARGVTHRLALHDDLDALQRAYRSSVRQGIRVAAREGVVVRRAEKAGDLTDAFYGLHVATRRRLGVPVQPRRYFQLLWDRVLAPGGGYVLLAELNGVPLAAAVFLSANGVVVYKYGASDAAHLRLRANAALFHEAISQSAADGCRIFDWGRTDFEDEGLRRFKASWGSSEHELVYTAFGAVAEPASTPNGGSLAGLSRTVIRRSPSIVSRFAGALLYRYAG
jgi:hypothetical protein